MQPTSDCMTTPRFLPAPHPVFSHLDKITPCIDADWELERNGVKQRLSLLIQNKETGAMDSEIRKFEERSNE